MFFHIEERHAWLRAATHTLVFDRDPDFETFRDNPSGIIKRLLRIWLAETRGERTLPRAYLGCIGFCAGGPSRWEIARVLRRTMACEETAGEPGRVLRHRLLAAIRGRLRA